MLGRRILPNTAAQFVTPAFRAAAGLLIVATLTRYLGADDFGRYALVFATTALFSALFAEWGIGTVVLREISRRPASRSDILGSAVALQLALGGLAYVVMALSTALLRYPDQLALPVLLYGLSILALPVDLLTLTFQADLRSYRLIGPSVAGIVAQLIFTAAVVALGGSLIMLVLAALIALVLQYVWLGVLGLLEVRRLGRPSVSACAALFREAWPIGAGHGLKALWQQLPILFLASYSLDAVGHLSAAWKLPLQVVIVALAIQASAFPLLSRLWVIDRGRFNSILDALVRGAATAAVPALVAATLGAPLLMGTIFGHDFVEAALPFALLCATAALLFPIIFLAEALNAARHQHVVPFALFTLLPVLIVLLVVLVPRFGAAGAAVAILLAHVGYLLILVLGAYRRLAWRVPARALIRHVVALTIGLGTGAATNNFGQPLSLLLGVAAATALLARDLRWLGSDLVRTLRAGGGGGPDVRDPARSADARRLEA